MTDEMMVQAQKPSAMPYVLGGAGVGALGGLASAKYANFGVTTPKYSSWEEAINDSNDEFVKKQIEKGGDKKADFEKLQTAQKEVKEAKENLDKALGDKLKDNADVKDYLKKAEEFDKAEAKLIKDLEARITKGEFDVKLEGDELKKAIANDENVKNAKAAIDAKLDETIKNLHYTDIEGGKTAREQAEFILKGNSEFNQLKDNLVKAETTAEESLNKSFKELQGEDLTKKAKELLAEDKNKTDDFKNALKAKDEALEKAKKVEGFTDDIAKKVQEAEIALKNVKDKFKNAFTDDFIKSMKTAHVGWTALAGAAILGLAGYLFAPKGEKV